MPAYWASYQDDLFAAVGSLVFDDTRPENCYSSCPQLHLHNLGTVNNVWQWRLALLLVSTEIHSETDTLHDLVVWPSDARFYF